MYLTVKQQLNHLSKDDYKILRNLSHTAKNLTNQAIYAIRQHYFNTGSYLSYKDCYHLMKSSDNYRMLNSNMAQQILKEVDGSFQSFFALLSKKDQSPRLPHYMPKDGHATLVIGFVRIKENKLIVPYSNQFRKTHKNIIITIPPLLLDKKIKEIRIIPKSDARFFEIQYCYEAKVIQRNLNINNALALDPGVNNLLTAVTTEGRNFIIDGRTLKSHNQWYTKETSRLKAIKDKQGYRKKSTKRMSAIYRKRNNRINDYMSKSAKMIVDYCIANNIGTVVMGYNDDFQKDVKFLKKDKQNFLNIPFGKLRSKLRYLCELNGIRYYEQEESYTSRASFFDRDDIPVYRKGDTNSYTFSGRRIHRGMYKRNSGQRYNSDVNGALNILRKSKVVDIEVLYHRGEVDTPERIRVA